MKPGTPELVAAAEEIAVATDNAKLALQALHLREGADDFIGDAGLLADVIHGESRRCVGLAARLAKSIETEPSSLAALGVGDLVRSLEFQLLFARRLAEFIQADVERGAHAAQGGVR